MTGKMGGLSRLRSAITGRFVSKSAVRKSPKTTVAEKGKKKGR